MIVTLISFFIFDPTKKIENKNASDEEKQDNKILYYYPENEDNYIRRSNIGILECSISFFEIINKYNRDDFILIELENNSIICKEYEFNKFISLIIEIKNEFECFLDKKKLLENLLDNLYKNFILYHGLLNEIDNLIYDDNILYLKKRFSIKNKKNKIINNRRDKIISDFLENYFLLLKHSNFQFINNLNYFSINDFNYTKIVLLINQLKEKLNSIEFYSILYKGNIIYNEIPLEDFSIIYNNYFNNLENSKKYNDFSNPLDFSIQKLNSEEYEIEGYDFQYCMSQIRKGFDGVDPYFINGFKNNNNSKSINVFLPKIFLSKLNKKYKMLVYSRKGFLFFFFIKENYDYINNCLCLKNNIEKYIQKYFETEIELLKTIYSFKIKHIDPINFIYFSLSNLSIKLSSNFYDKGHILNKEKFKQIELSSYNNLNFSFMRIIKRKNILYFIFYILQRKIIIKLDNNFELKESLEEINGFLKNLFDHIFFIS